MLATTIFKDTSNCDGIFILFLNIYYYFSANFVYKCQCKSYRILWFMSLIKSNQTVKLKSFRNHNFFARFASNCRDITKEIGKLEKLKDTKYKQLTTCFTFPQDQRKFSPVKNWMVATVSKWDVSLTSYFAELDVSKLVASWLVKKSTLILLSFKNFLYLGYKLHVL